MPDGADGPGSTAPTVRVAVGFARRLPLLLAAASFLIAGLIVSRPLRGPAIAAPTHRGAENEASRDRCGWTSRSDAILSFNAYQEAWAAARIEDADALREQTGARVRKALGCFPVQADLWAAAARMRMLEAGFDETAARYLELSCATGPNAFWVARIREPLMRPVERLLSPDLMDCLHRDQASLARKGADN